ncbi:peroxisomal biogenesis factor 2 [Amylocystis lapponica]|nr:peroxisomal biogenesis factor 2 [Amylocystis lapponica]
MSSDAPSTSSSWQRAWDDAQPRLAHITESLKSTSSPSERIIRVGQLDAELLDQELAQLLKEPLVKALNSVNSAWKTLFDPELTLLIHLTLYKLSVWNFGASYGAKLQGLRYACPRSNVSSVTASGLPRRTLLLHGTLTLLVPYLRTRLRAHALSHAWPDAPSSDRRRRAWELLTRLESMHSLFGLWNFIAFLWDGRYRTVVDRILDLQLVSAQRFATRDVSYEFMNRQMVWHAFTEFLLFLLPLINARALRRRLSAVYSQLTPSSILPASLRSRMGMSRDGASTPQQPRRGKYWALSLDQCAICAENASTNISFADPANALNTLAAIPSYAAPSVSADNAAPPDTADSDSDSPPPHPINTPYITSCGHVYCYYCVSERMMRAADERSGVGAGGTQWECVRCGEGVTSTDRVEMRADGSDHGSGMEDEMELEYGSEDLEFTDLSGSVGTYSEYSGSGLSE